MPAFTLTRRGSDSDKWDDRSFEVVAQAKADPNRSYVVRMKRGAVSNTAFSLTLAPDGRLIGLNAKSSDPLPTIVKPIGDLVGSVIKTVTPVVAADGTEVDMLTKMAGNCKAAGALVEAGALKPLAAVDGVVEQSVKDEFEKAVGDCIRSGFDEQEGLLPAANRRYGKLVQAYEGLLVVRARTRKLLSVGQVLRQRRDDVHRALASRLAATTPVEIRASDAILAENSARYARSLDLILLSISNSGFAISAAHRADIVAFLSAKIPQAADKDRAAAFAAYRSELDRIDASVNALLTPTAAASGGTNSVVGIDVPSMHVTRAALTLNAPGGKKHEDEEVGLSRLDAFARAWWEFGLNPSLKSPGVPGGVIYLDGAQ